MNKEEMSFDQWFAETAAILGLHKDVNHPSNRDYDYVAAYYSGIQIPRPGQELPSKFKGDLHTNRYINIDGQAEYYDSKTQQVVGVQDVMVQSVRRKEREENFLNQDE